GSNVSYAGIITTARMARECRAPRSTAIGQPSVNTFRRVYDLLSPYPGRVLLALGLAGLACLLNLPTPVLIQGLVVHVVAGGALSSVPLYALALLAVFALQSGTSLA